jgi:hypothetical protein
MYRLFGHVHVSFSGEFGRGLVVIKNSLEARGGGGKE